MMTFKRISMMKHNTKYSILSVAVALAVAAFGSCQRDELVDRTPAGENILNFSVGFAGSGELVFSKGAALASEDGTVSIPLSCAVTDGIGVNLPGATESAKATKGTQINSESEFLGAELTSFTAAGWTSDKTEFIPLSTTVSYSNSKWQTSSAYKWRGLESKTFLAYANMPSSGATVLNSVDPVKQTFTYTVPTDARQQNDIMLGWYEGYGGGTATAAITMVHPLTAVVFKKGEMEGITAIKSISISGVYVNGTADVTYALSDGDVVPTYNWGSSRTGSQTVTLSPAGEATELEVADDGKIGTSFIILPQTVAAGALTLTITVVKDGEEAVLLADVPAGTWQEGKTNTYTIGYEAPDYILNVIGNINPLSHNGGNLAFSIESYQDIAGGLSRKKVPWTLEYYNAETSEWLPLTASSLPNALFDETHTFSAFSGSGAIPGNTDDVNVSVKAGVQETTTMTLTEHTNILRSAPAKGTQSAPYDLSMHTVYGEQRATGAPVTANCYVVSAGGWYCLPLVYGNSYNGSTTPNTVAYAPTATTNKNTYLTPFRNAIGTINPDCGGIIETDAGVTLTTAAVQWED